MSGDCFNPVFFLKKSFVVVSWFSSVFFLLYTCVCLHLTDKFSPTFSFQYFSVKCLVSCISTEEVGN